MHLRLLSPLLVIAFLLTACPGGEDVEEPDVSEDVESPEEDTSDDPDTDDDADAGEDPDATDRVLLDFDHHFDPPSSGFVRATQIDDPADLIDGEVSQALLGDWLLENDHGRYIVGLDERAIGPCSWDGNPIETEALIDGDGTESVLGEICFLINVGQTVAPEHVEILEDGSNGRAIIAVTGRTTALDFLNLNAMAGDFAPGLLDNLDIDPNRAPPLRVTFYYVLTPESRSLRVLTALRNDGDAPEYFVAAHLVLSGSTGSYFTPLGYHKGWGYRSLGLEALVADPVSFLGYIADHAGYVVVPDPAEHMERALPVGAGMLAVSGAVALVHGTTNVIQLLTAQEPNWPTTQGMIGLPAGDTTTVGYRLYPSDGTVATAADWVYQDLGVDTAQISGRVVDHEGTPQADVKISALRDGDRTYNMTRTASDGTFSMRVPFDTWELRLRHDLVLTSHTDIDVTGADVHLGDLDLREPALLSISVQTPDEDPTPARVIIACPGGCPEAPDGRERDPLFQAPMGWFRLVELGVDGQASIPLAPGDYLITVNRGMTWTTWPQDATEAAGFPISVDAGDTVELTAEIAQVVDTTGVLSADFHVHAMASPDSQTSKRERVLDLMAGGLDVIVSTDHDAVADFGPTISALGADQQVTSIIGNEITSSNLGHINAFPLEYDPTHRRGGALDWSNGSTYHMDLQSVIDAVREHPGEQVIQLNHPGMPMGAIGLMNVDLFTGISLTPPETLWKEPREADPDTGDTGLWSEEFDAIEVYNGFNMGNFWGYFRWWITMVGRGFSPTATAVSDTHGIYGSLGASPRSWVFVDDAHDTPSTMALDHFVDRVRYGALVGTNGPFMRVEIENPDGEIAAIGDTLDASDGEVIARITLEMPEWIDVDTLDLYFNVPAEDLQGQPGQTNTSALEPTQRIQVQWDPTDHRELVASGQYEHHRLRQTIEVPLEITADSYLVVMARGLSARTMRPVLSSGTAPLAFSNPIFLDFDGGGYDNPPLADAVAAMQEDLSRPQMLLERAREDRVIIPRGEPLTAENLGRLIEALTCDHGDPEETPHHHHHPERGHHHHGHHHHGHGHHHHH